MTWYVLYVKANCERQVAEMLREMNIEVYFPLIKETRQWSDRKKKVEVPLFKSYVFVRLVEKNRRMVFDVPGVVRYVFWLGKPAVVREAEIDTIKNWLENECIDEISISRWVIGEEITLEKGPFKNRKALVQEVGKTRLRLVLKGLGIIVTAKIKELV